MINILHGDHLVKSREALSQILDNAATKGTTTVRLEAKGLSVPDLEEALGSQQLFDTEKIIIIEGIHSLPKSARKNQLIEMLGSADAQATHQIVLWESRSLTKTMLKNFFNAQQLEFKLSKSLFSWLEKIGERDQQKQKLSLLHEAVNTDGDYFCFLMLIRQLRMLIQVKTGGDIAGPPFLKSKIRRQSESFSLPELLAIYNDLLRIDLEQKTSDNALTLGQELDILTVKM